MYSRACSHRRSVASSRILGIRDSGFGIRIRSRQPAVVIRNQSRIEPPIESRIPNPESREEMMPRLSVILASIRQGRGGYAIAQWFMKRAQEHGKFDAQLVDLKDVDLPLLSEPKHPRLRQYEQETTKAWSAIVGASDAFVFVTAEYNYSTP